MWSTKKDAHFYLIEGSRDYSSGLVESFDSISGALGLIYTDLELMELFLWRLCPSTWWGWRHAAKVLELEGSIEASPIIKI